MTKKKALKTLMALGVQRNEAQKLLLAKHNEGFTNLEALIQAMFILRSGTLKILQRTNSGRR